MKIAKYEFPDDLLCDNDEIEWESTVINAEPYGAGWFARVELASQPEGLLKPADPAFAAFVAAERARYGK